MKLCDLTQFYAPRSGGVKRYLHEKISFIERHRPNDSHVLIVPGRRNRETVHGNSRTCEIASPLVPRSGGYRVLLNLKRVGEIIESERPQILECADPYQLGWGTINISRVLRIPAIAFYHSHFTDAYVRPALQRWSMKLANKAATAARAYVRRLYNQFHCTLVSSRALADELRGWGVRNVRVLHLGIAPEIFSPARCHSLGRNYAEPIKLLYVGRLAREKNVRTLAAAFELLRAKVPGRFRLVIIGDGPSRTYLPTGPDVTTVSYYSELIELAEHYRAADLFVHPGVQETFGLAALESQACGTPVVGFIGTPMDEVIMHDQQSWAHERTPAALADAIEAMSRRDLQQLGGIAAERVHERFAWPAIFERLFCVYEEVIANYSRA